MKIFYLFRERDMPSHVSQNGSTRGLSGSKLFVQSSSSTISDAEKLIAEVMINISEKRSLAWSLARLSALEAQLLKK